MRIFIIVQQEVQDLDKFIDYWSELYKRELDEKYLKNINKSKFSEEDIISLFEWKNGMTLSNLKRESLEKNIIKKLAIINEYKSRETINTDDFLEEFKSVSAVWRIFLLHTIKPNTYPIYDQHVHRAYNIVHDLPFEEVNSEMKDSEKLKFYTDTYLPFIDTLKAKFDLKKVDEALVSFGQFFRKKTNNTKLIF